MGGQVWSDSVKELVINKPNWKAEQPSLGDGLRAVTSAVDLVNCHHVSFDP